ncbi:MAG: alkaline phosphatase family protein [Rubrivivax sp.]|nr:alkaline phosphatase family protein [Pyrinomonadaceae bacterium]
MRKISLRWVALGLATLLIVALVYLIRSSATVSEIAELATQGGEQKLREEMRPLRPGARVLVFALDGVGADELQEGIRSGKAPRIQSVLGAEVGAGVFAHGYAAPEALSILPSTTMAAWASVYTGQPPARTGVPGNEWFAREEMKFYAPAPVSVTESEHTLKMLTDGLVGNAIRTPTLYELADVRSHVSLAPVYRGADLFTNPEPSILVDLFGAAAKGVVSEQTISQKAYQQVDEESVDTLVEEIEQHGVPNLQVIYFPGIDLFSHVAETPLEQQPSYLQEVLDPAIGRVLDAYERAGALGETYILFIADHGHTPVLADDLHSLGTEGDDEPPSVIRQAGFRLRPFVLEPEEDKQDYQAAVAYQGAMAYVYLADRSTCPAPGQRCDWKRAPRLEEDVMPVVRAFHKVNETGEAAPQLKGTIDLIFAREPRPPGEDALPFKIFDGRKLVPIADYLKKNSRPDLLKLEERMEGLAAGPYGHRAGDILLLSRSGVERPVEERFYFSGPYRSWHGSPTAQDSHVPFILARRGDSGERLRGAVADVVGEKWPSQLDVVPLILSLLNRQPSPK